ncbi:sugar transferase [Flavimaricola marinus]|uniref:UDP-N-acetylgalactosamine-undecaprenyl-phosphate N-acetylgalactosaminephosphotransferase n=1 Tax=Flavimaricola marinus TaxID=1819565 RepID=A0A238LBV8_9RHOB|nr:sugar transferase [Flavimaricola marinus]SMY06894.1 UDP-N-acetylgalactosamine-undecaprenyl-phosphate N-acetylgalactosaminephosphotransferase [Flavimaricola marinus]
MSYQYRSSYTGAHLPRPVSASVHLGGAYRRFFKRGLDLLIVVVASVPVALTVLVLALLVALDGRNPFYVQPRLGKGGRTFRMWKLRTMVVNAEETLDSYLEANPVARIEWDCHQKLVNDPRTTAIGRFLRKSSLDELPQLWNVFKGEMSIVGPRPIMICQKSMYPGNEYYEMLPGVTGFWQVSERNETSFFERADYDSRYYRAMSLGTDLKVIAQTVKVVLSGTGH